MLQFPWLTASRLWLVTNKQACKPKTVSQVLGEVITQGIDVVLFRDKVSSALERRRSAELVQEQCLSARIPLAIAHDLELAMQLNAEAIHLGQGGHSIAQTREALGDSTAIGYSCHSIQEAKDVMRQGADYVFLGPIFASPEKLKFGPPLGPNVISPALELPGKVIFIGGMDEVTIPAAMGQGARCFAAIRALQGGPDPAQRVSLIANRLQMA